MGVHDSEVEIEFLLHEIISEDDAELDSEMDNDKEAAAEVE